MKIAGIVLVVVGLGLAYWGYQESGGLSSQFNEMVSGGPGDNVMIKYIGAAVCVAVGGFLFTKK
jgi:hypothetical protein